MAYTPTNWQTGDTITAALLNRLENAVADSGPLVVTITGNDNDGYVADKTVNEIYGAILSEREIIAVLTNYTYGDETLSLVFYFTGADSTGALIFCSQNFGVKVYIRIVEDNDVRVYPFPDYGELFVVTLTPTAQDFSGTMDKTPADIEEAYLIGARIRLDIPSLGVAADATQYITAGGVQAMANTTYNTNGQHMIIQIMTSASDSTYSTIIYPLTPMS